MNKIKMLFWLSVLSVNFLFAYNLNAALSSDWWVTDKGVIDYANGIISFSLPTPFINQAIGNKNFSVEKGHTYILEFDGYASNNMKLEIFFRQEGGSWTPYSSKTYEWLTDSPLKQTFSIVSGFTDPNATLLINCGFNAGDLTLKNVTLKDSGLPPVPIFPLDNNWWYTTDGSIDHGGGIINFDIPVLPANSYEKAFGRDNFNVKAGKYYKINFTASTNQVTPILAKIRLNRSPWTSYGENYIEIPKGIGNYSIILFSDKNDPAAALVFECGYTTGKFSAKNIETSEHDTKKYFVPLIVK